MARKNILHELLKQEQEPFHLQDYLAEKCGQLQKPTSKLKQHRNLRKNVCFSSSHDSTNPTTFLCGATQMTPILFQGHHPSKQKSQVTGDLFGLFGSFVKKFHNGNNKKSRVTSGNKCIEVSSINGWRKETICGDNVSRKSCSWSRINGRQSSFHRSESNDEKSAEWQASTCGYSYEESQETNDDFTSKGMSLCSSSFRFYTHNSPPSSGSQTLDLCTPAASPSRHPDKENENHDIRISKKGGEEEKEQCSPLSVLEPSFEDYEDGNGSDQDAEEDSDLEYSYQKVKRTKQQLLYRLQRFEKLAELDSDELERRLLEESDNNNRENVDWEDGIPLSLHEEIPCVTNFSIQNSTKISADMKRPIVERENIALSDCSRSNSWKETKLEKTYRMIESDLNKEFDGWKEFAEEVNETAAEMEIEIFDLLMEKLLDEVFKRTCRFR